VNVNLFHTGISQVCETCLKLLIINPSSYLQSPCSPRIVVGTFNTSIESSPVTCMAFLSPIIPIFTDLDAVSLQKG